MQDREPHAPRVACGGCRVSGAALGCTRSFIASGRSARAALDKGILCVMPWNVVTMRTDLSDLEVAGFIREFTAAHVREVQTGLNKEYRLYRRAIPRAEQIVFIPPDAVHLAEQTPTWGRQIKQLSVLPNLTGCSELKIRQAAQRR